MNNKTLAVLLLVILAILLLILILSCELSKTKKKSKSYSECTSCKKKSKGSCSSCDASVVSLNSFTADNVYVGEGNQNENMNITFASENDAYNTLQGNNNFTYNPSTGTLNVDFINAVFTGSLQLGNDGIVYQKNNTLNAVPYENAEGKLLTVENGSLVWKNPQDIISGGGSGGPVENLYKLTRGILYQTGDNQTSTLSTIGHNGKILWVNENGELAWVNPSTIPELKGADGIDGKDGINGIDGRSYGLKYIIKIPTNNYYFPELGQITYDSNSKILYVNKTDADGIDNTRWLFTDLKIGDKIIVQMLNNAKIFISQTFEVKSNPEPLNVFDGEYKIAAFAINVDYYTGYYLLENSVNANNTVYVTILNKGATGPQGPPGESGANALLNLNPKIDGQILGYIDGKLQWTDDKTGGGSGGPVSNLSKTPKGILYQTGPEETSVLEYENNQGILINDDGKPRWVNPSNMESLRGPAGPAGPSGIYGLRYIWDSSGPAYTSSYSTGRFTLLDTFQKTSENTLYISNTDSNNMNTDLLIQELKIGDKMIVQLPSSSNIYRTFTLTSVPQKFSTYYTINVSSTSGPTGWVLPIGPLTPVYIIVSNRGPQGIQGPAGRDGTNGAQGPPGRDGVDGAQGPPGRDGTNGAQGPPGRDGVDGAPGPAGPAGIYGLRYLWDSSGPGYTSSYSPGRFTLANTSTNSLTNTLYISNTDSNNMNTDILISELKVGDKIVAQLPSSSNIYQTFTLTSVPQKFSTYYTINVSSTSGPTGWVLPIGPLTPVYIIVSNRGPQGIQGPAGRDGTNGAQGPPGRDGVDGAQGPPGRDGTNGAQGPPGRDGVNGLPGRDGMYGLRYVWDSEGPVLFNIPNSQGTITLDNSPNISPNNLYVSVNDSNRINTEILFSELKVGDKIVVQFPDFSNTYQTFTLTSVPQKVNNLYFKIPVTSTPSPTGWVLPIGIPLVVYVIISNRGPQGPAGPAGRDGTNGAQGPPGPPGESGITGILNLGGKVNDYVLAYDGPSNSLKWRADYNTGSGVANQLYVTNYP